MAPATLVGTSFINGQRCARLNRQTLDHTNSTTGKVQAEITIASADDVSAAVASARAAQPDWAAMAGADRRNTLLKLAESIDGHAEELADIGVLENGTPRAFGSYVYGAAPADWFRYYAGWADKFEGRTIPVFPVPSLNYTLHEPYGVIGVLTAFNAPMSFIGMKVAAALAAGNAVVLKPSELAPFSTVRFAELCIEAGLPAGLVNVVLGDGRVGAAVAGHEDVDKVTFTGGAPTARHILGQLAELVRPATLELGGKSAAIVFDDGNIDAAVATVMQNGVAMLAGQACLAPTRLLVERRIYDEVIDMVVDVAEDIEVGDPSDPSTLMGPLISEQHRDRVLGVIDTARSEGAGRLLIGGTRITEGELAAGFFVPPTVFADVDPFSSLAQQEVFGPVLSIMPFEDEGEAIRLANSTRYGLAGYLYTENLRRAHRVAAALQAGYVSINSFNMLPPSAPFGGYRQSGIGREGGLEGLLEMARTKNVYCPLD